jgi:transmembrane sensor
VAETSCLDRLAVRRQKVQRIQMNMMMAKDIDTAAADWAARIDRGTLTADEDGALAQWMAQDARHHGAFMRMRAIALHTERARALGPAFDPERIHVVDKWPERRSWAKSVALAAAASAAAIFLLPLFFGSEQYGTRRGEVKVVPLEDGTVMTLNTASTVEVNYSAGRREIRLLGGEAVFDVAKDAARPFVVEVGSASVRAVGTSFSAHRLENAPLHVLVREGVVQLEQSSLRAPLRLEANMHLELSEGAAEAKIRMVDASEIGRRLAWMEGRIAFEGETLADAVAAFARYSDTSIVITDPALAQRQITGLFMANDPVSFARAVAATLSLQTKVRGGTVYLTP